MVTSCGLFRLGTICGWLWFLVIYCLWLVVLVIGWLQLVTVWCSWLWFGSFLWLVFGCDLLVIVGYGSVGYG